MHPCNIKSSSSESLSLLSTVKADKLVLELDFDIQLGVPSTQNFFTSSVPLAAPASDGVAEEKIKALEVVEVGAAPAVEADLTGIRVALFMLPLVRLKLENKDTISEFREVALNHQSFFRFAWCDQWSQKLIDKLC